VICAAFALVAIVVASRSGLLDLLDEMRGAPKKQ